MPRVKTLILGAGPTGLGAAWRLNELGETNWLLIDKENRAGGLASSTVDENGFIWDIGGHVLFSHYKYFDDLMDNLLGDDWQKHQREAWIWTRDQFIPYPFQNNIRLLPKETMWECLSGLIRAQKNKRDEKSKNFKEWSLSVFGEGIQKHFMEPYNFKVWGYDMEKMSSDWIGERVSIIDLERIARNIIFEKDDLSWGPNNLFRFPLYGGTGKIWQTLAGKLPKEKIKYNVNFEFVNTQERTVKFSNGEEIHYENLISTIPLDIFIKRSDAGYLKEQAKKLMHSSVHIVGIGIKGKLDDKLKSKCWIYFPEISIPFYRVTVFSNYSPNNTPQNNIYWSLMCEISETVDKPVNQEKIIDKTIQGLIDSKLISAADNIASKWHYRAEYAYPTPSINRDNALFNILPVLSERGIYSRGRFGAWKYEVANMDHSFMQGVECVDKIIKNTEEITAHQSVLINRK